MHRIFGVIALGLCVGVAAAYGGSSLRSLAHNEAKSLGDPHAAITRFEKVRVGRNHWAMIQMKGRRAFGTNCFRPRPQELWGPCHADYLEVAIDLTNRQQPTYWGLTASEVSAITSARQASPRFQIFPDTTNLSVRCAIPHGGLRGDTLTGICATVAYARAHVKHVEFIEHWSLRGAAHGARMRAGWMVAVHRHGRATLVRVIGEPPQLWK